MLCAVATDTRAGGPDLPLDIELLYAECFPRVRAFAFRMLGNEDTALDVAQDTFAMALAAAESFRGESSPLTWLLAITRNLCLRRLSVAGKRRFEDFEAIMTGGAEEPAAGHSESELRLYIEEVKEGCLIGLLQCLPVSQRCVFVLHLLSDLPVADVARIMGKSENSIRILLSRSRARMRAFLCLNCSLLGGSRCSCANMIEFSLKHDLIDRYRPEPGIAQIKAELRRFSDEVELYRSLPRHEEAIAHSMGSGRYAIFSTE